MKERRMQILEDGTVIPCGFHNHDPITQPREPHIYTEKDLKESLEERTKEILEIVESYKDNLAYPSTFSHLHYKIKTKYGL